MQQSAVCQLLPTNQDKLCKGRIMKIAQVLFDQSQQSFSDTSGKNLVLQKTGTFISTPPLTARTKNSIPFTGTNSLTIQGVPIAKRTHEEEEFSISFYIKATDTFTTSENIIYNSSNDIGLSIFKSNIVFTISDYSNNLNSISYKIPEIGNSYHIAAVYSKRSMSLFVDGVVRASLSLPTTFEFKATSDINLLLGGTSSILLIDKIEVFNEAIDNMYINEEIVLDSLYQSAGQIICLDDASYFSFSKNIKPVKTGFSYGSNKSFSTALMVDVNEAFDNYVILNDGKNSGYFTDSVFITTIENNQIDWYGDSGGIDVAYNTDGSSTYTALVNHSSIPNFTGGMLYYKVTLTRDSSTLPSPAFTGMDFISYDSKEFRSDNTLYFLDTDFSYHVGKYSNSILSQSLENGIKTLSGGVKVIDTTARSIEFMFMPSALGQTCLVDCGTSRYSWSGAGNITKTDVSSIYVNGVNLYSQTSVSNVFTIGVWHHVVITFSQDQLDTVYLNQSKTGTLIGSDNSFAHLGIYNYDMSTKAISHYKHLTSRVSEATSADSISIGSDSYSGYNVDKVVLSTQ